MNACFCMRLCNPVVRRVVANSGNDFDFGFCFILWLSPKLIFAAFTAFVFAVPSSHSIHLLLWHCSVSAFRRGTKMHSSLADGQAVGICIQLYGIGPNNKHVCTLKRIRIFRRNLPIFHGYSTRICTELNCNEPNFIFIFYITSFTFVVIYM